MAEERSYLVVRGDGLLVHTKPVSLYKAWWLHQSAYNSVEDRAARMRYLEEWGNVMDAGGYVERLRQSDRDLYLYVAVVYEDPEEFAENVGRLLKRGDLQPGARQALEEFLSRAREFLQKPVEPRPIASPARYFEAPSMDVAPGPGGVSRAEPEWYAYKEVCCREYYGISVFRDSFWLWRQEVYGAKTIQAVVVRRDASGGEVIGAVTSDAAALGLLNEYAERLRQLISEREEEMRERGYEDVARKFKVILATLELLNAGRREEEGVPA